MNSVAVSLADILFEMPCSRDKIIKHVDSLVKQGIIRAGSPVSQTNWQIIRALLEINRQLEITNKRGVTPLKDYDQMETIT